MGYAVIWRGAGIILSRRHGPTFPKDLLLSYGLWKSASSVSCSFYLALLPPDKRMESFHLRNIPTDYREFGILRDARRGQSVSTSPSGEKFILWLSGRVNDCHDNSDDSEIDAKRTFRQWSSFSSHQRQLDGEDILRLRGRLDGWAMSV